MTKKNKIKGILKDTSAASFNWSFLSGTSPSVAAQYWGISDPKEYRHRIALAQLADTLLIKDKLLLGDTAEGLIQVFHAFRPSLAIEVLKLGRIVGLTAPGKLTNIFENLCCRHTDDMPEILHSFLKNIYWVKRTSKQEQNRFIQVGLDNISELKVEEYEQIKEIASTVSRKWLENCTEDSLLLFTLQKTPYIYSRLTNHWQPTQEQHEN